MIEVGPSDGMVVPGVLRAAEQHQLAVEPMTAAEIEQRWPGLRVGDELVGVFEPAAGYLLVEDCVQAHLDAACAVESRLLRIDQRDLIRTLSALAILPTLGDDLELIFH